MGERVDSVARPARCWLNDAQHFAGHICPPLLRAPPSLPCSFAPRSAPQVCPVVQRGCWWACCQAGLGGGGRPTLALVPPSGSFPTGGPMHALPVRV